MGCCCSCFEGEEKPKVQEIKLGELYYTGYTIALLRVAQFDAQMGPSVVKQDIHYTITLYILYKSLVKFKISLFYNVGFGQL